MTIFIAVVHKDPDSAWSLFFPDLPGCYSAADESADIVANAQEALDLWFDDQPMVEPRDMEAIRAEVAEDLREGAFLLGVPYPAGVAAAAE